MDLLGRGYATWMPFVNGPAMVHTFIEYTGLSSGIAPLSQSVSGASIVLSRQAIMSIATTRYSLF